MNPLARIIDANSNRAREALRVVDDVARFALNDRDLCEMAKSLRHRFVAVLQDLPIDRPMMLAARDTMTDVGASVSTPAEFTRRGLGGVAQAAAARLSEALRSIEEALKALNAATAAAEVESIRYASYELEKRLLLALGTGRGRQWRLCVLITESLCAHHPWFRVAELALEAGADCLQLREKALGSAEILARAQRLVSLAGRHHAAVIINDRPDIALLAQADGVHVGQTDLAVGLVRQLAGNRLLVGVSTEDAAQARAAFSAGADYCGLGPMFATTTKDKPRLAGTAYLRSYLALPGARPHLAIGGITPANAGELAAAGCRGFAVSSCVCASPDPAAVCRSLLAAIPTNNA